MTVQENKKRRIKGRTHLSLRMNVVPHQVVGPFGEAPTLAALPPPETARWTIRRKAEVVAAVGGSLLTIDEACERYSLSVEELTSWQRVVHRSGMPGLRVTRIQQYRDFYERRDGY